MKFIKLTQVVLSSGKTVYYETGSVWVNFSLVTAVYEPSVCHKDYGLGCVICFGPDEVHCKETAEVVASLVSIT
jgi:hypothetical protein